MLENILQEKYYLLDLHYHYNYHYIKLAEERKSSLLFKVSMGMYVRTMYILQFMWFVISMERRHYYNGSAKHFHNLGQNALIYCERQGT